MGVGFACFEHGECAATRVQLGVGTGFHDAARVHDNDQVGVAHGTDTVGDLDDGAALRDAGDALAYARLGDRVNLARGLVEDVDGRVAQERACQGQALTLAARGARPCRQPPCPGPLSPWPASR